MKNKGIILGIVALAGLGFYYYNSAPKFSIESYDHLTKEGTFIFDGSKNTFGNKGGSVSGKNGYSLVYGNNKEGTTYFHLYKKGNFIKAYQPFNLVK